MVKSLTRTNWLWGAVALLAVLCAVAVAGEAAPAATAATWATNAKTAADANASQAAETAANVSNWGAWAAAILGSLIGIAKLLPRTSPLASAVISLAGLVYDTVVHKDQKAIESKQVILSDGLVNIVDIIEELSNDKTIGDLKTKLANRLPSPILDAVNKRVAELKTS
jgi:hypothetical protein